ncbi:MAG: hypothetical protein Q8S73_20420 [Deltaproteobacteria bacterium]|nr:hypothetical protein [Myxococcales bacterium]MDP3216485.1 hypothetical protein [Deltaproteobacteria bacterium]
METAILLDVPNLLRGAARPASDDLLRGQLAAIDLCAATLFGDPSPRRAAFALRGITGPGVEDPLRAAGYDLTWCSPDRTASMDLKRLSRLDDYELQRSAKRMAQDGCRGLLIASADRDPEDVAFDLEGSGVRVAFAQWDPVPPRRGARVERVCLQDARAATAPARDPAVEVRRGAVVLASVPLRDGLWLGRNSNTFGSPDVDLGAREILGAEGRAYSRRLAVVRRLGGSWCLWRFAGTEGRVELADGEPLLPGATALLGVGESVFRLAGTALEIAFRVGPKDARGGD